MSKKHFITLMMAAFLGTGTASSATPGDEGLCCLKNGDLTICIDTEKGGKVLSFKYKDQEVISQSRWPESFGSTFWTSPQKEWNWPPVPEYDKQPYKVVQRDDSRLVIESGVSERMKYRIGKDFQVDKKRGGFIVTYTIENMSNETRSVAPWEITRVPNGGIIFFDAQADKITPAGLMAFENAYGAAWYKADATNENRKVNADARGWLAFANNGLLLLKKFEDLNEGQPAPGEAEVQVYVNRGTSYIELESQGAYTQLAPGQKLTWSVRWNLVPVKQADGPSKALMKIVKKSGLF